MIPIPLLEKFGSQSLVKVTPVVQLLGFHLLWHAVELAMSTRLCLLQWFIWFLCFRFEALTKLGAFMRTIFYVFPY